MCCRNPVFKTGLPRPRSWSAATFREIAIAYRVQVTFLFCKRPLPAGKPLTCKDRLDEEYENCWLLISIVYTLHPSVFIYTTILIYRKTSNWFLIWFPISLVAIHYIQFKTILPIHVISHNISFFSCVSFVIYRLLQFANILRYSTSYATSFSSEKWFGVLQILWPPKVRKASMHGRIWYAW